MIRKMLSTDLDSIMKIWLESNISTHDFIEAEYWYKHYNMVKEMILQTDIYLYEMDNRIIGFVGIMDYYIAGLFIDKDYQSKGIGTKLLNFCKKRYLRLDLDVYVKNEKAVVFYQKNGFIIKKINLDNNTKQKEYHMSWCKSN